MGKWLWHSPVLQSVVLLHRDIVKYLEEVSKKNQGSILCKGLLLTLPVVKHSFLNLRIFLANLRVMQMLDSE